jgi:hypothetical protein
MFFRRGTLHLAQPVPLCKQAAAHYTCRKGITLEDKALAHFAKSTIHLMQNARRALRRKEMTSWPR